MRVNEMMEVSVEQREARSYLWIIENSDGRTIELHVANQIDYPSEQKVRITMDKHDVKRMIGLLMGFVDPVMPEE